MVTGLFGKPRFVDMPKDIVDAMKMKGSTRSGQYPSLKRNLNSLGAVSTSIKTRHGWLLV